MTKAAKTDKLLRRGNWSGATDQVALTQAERKEPQGRFTTASGQVLAVDLAVGTHLSAGDAFALPDGRVVEIVAAQEDLTEVTGDLVLAALCIGQHRAPCQVEKGRLLVARGAGLDALLGSLGVTLRNVRQAFTPEPVFANETTMEHPSGEHPSGEHPSGHPRRHVHFHVSRDHDDDEETEPPASNA